MKVYVHGLREHVGPTAQLKVLRGWTIYRQPRDFPRHVVVRGWSVPGPGGAAAFDPVGCLCDSLTEARRCIPRGCVNLERDETDDPVIVETWL